LKREDETPILFQIKTKTRTQREKVQKKQGPVRGEKKGKRDGAVAYLKKP